MCVCLFLGGWGVPVKGSSFGGGRLEVAPILMRENSRKAREGGAADVAKDVFEKVPVEAKPGGGGVLLCWSRLMTLKVQNQQKSTIWGMLSKRHAFVCLPQGRLKCSGFALARPRVRCDRAEGDGSASTNSM